MTFFFKILDVPLYLLIILFCLLPFINDNSNMNASLIELVVNKETIAHFEHTKDSIYTFSGFSVEIKKCRCRIINSSCTDHLCESFGWLDSNSTARIICLPQKVILKNVINQRNTFDDITE